MPFEKPYLFKKTNTVIIKGPNGKSIRVKPGDLEVAEGLGKEGQFARFEADPQDGGSKVRFKSIKSGKYLRIFKGGDEINVAGGGGKFTVFKVIEDGGKGKVKLESNEFPGKFVAVGKNDNVRVGGGGPRCKLEIFRLTEQIYK